MTVNGTAYVRNLSCEIEWKEIDRVTGKLKQFRSIISKLGWEWEKNWNVYTEEAPFGLMLSQLGEFLRKCISEADYRHSFVEWEWDGKEFFEKSIKPAEDHIWHRCLSSECDITRGEDNRLYSLVKEKISYSLGRVPSIWDKRALQDKEPFFIKHGDSLYVNCDFILARLKETGIGGRCGSSPAAKFNLIKFLSSLPILMRLYNSRKELESMSERFSEFEKKLDAILARKKITEAKLLELFERYYLFLMIRRIIIYVLNKLPGYKKKCKEASSILELKNKDFTGKLFAELKKINPGWLISHGDAKPGAFWEDSGEKV